MAGKNGVPRLGPNDLNLAGTAQVLKDHPALNAGYIDGAICRYNEVNLGVAIDIETGLVVRLSVMRITGNWEIAQRVVSGSKGP
ncbi:MAG: hypothetical protein CM1200mP18_11130 [Gammaproteobacteria bacterium]|nr:MAG: hypothetical protein CM1200mP18_11130 [Gammaproteobacteria bacterium]